MSSLDADELFHLALKASEIGDHDKAINYLKESIEQDPTPRAYYILAAEHTEIGMMQRAIEGMEKAVSLDPQLWTAHLQLGLLYLTQNLPDEAVNCWKALEQLPEDDALFCFGEGLVALVDEDVETCISCLKKGIALNISNPALNGDMEKIISNINARLNSPDEKDSEEQDEKAEQGESKRHLFLSNYEGDKQ